MVSSCSRGSSNPTAISVTTTPRCQSQIRTRRSAPRWDSMAMSRLSGANRNLSIENPPSSRIVVPTSSPERSMNQTALYLSVPRPGAGEGRAVERRTIGARADPRGTAIPVPRGPVDRPNPAWLRWGIDVPEGDRARPGSATASARQHAPLRQEEGRTPAVGGEVRPLGSAASAHIPDLDPGAGDIVPDHHPRSLRRERHPGDVRHLGGGERDSLLLAGPTDR